MTICKTLKYNIMGKKKSTEYIERYRDAGTGQYVKKEYAEKHPGKTVKERDKKNK